MILKTTLFPKYDEKQGLIWLQSNGRTGKTAKTRAVKEACELSKITGGVQIPVYRQGEYDKYIYLHWIKTMKSQELIGWDIIGYARNGKFIEE